MANYEPDKVMFDKVNEGIKNLTDVLKQWQQKESAMHSMAEVQAKASGAPPEHMDAHIYMHKKAIKKAIADQAKEQEAGAAQAQGAPTGPGGPPLPMPPPSPQGAPSGPMGGPMGGAMGQGGPGMPQPVLPMAGQAGNTGANGWEGLMRPTPYPGQAQVQTGAPTSSAGPVGPGQQPMPGMPTPPPTGGPMMGRIASQTNTLPTAQPPLTRPMQ
jgi:hypothetical protein